MKQSLHRYTCDQCGVELIAEKIPSGWLRLLSTGKSMSHRGDPPVVWTPVASVELSEDGSDPAHLCSVDCLLAYVKGKAEKVLGHRRAR